MEQELYRMKKMHHHTLFIYNIDFITTKQKFHMCIFKGVVVIKTFPEEEGDSKNIKTDSNDTEITLNTFWIIIFALNGLLNVFRLPEFAFYFCCLSDFHLHLP